MLKFSLPLALFASLVVSATAISSEPFPMGPRPEMTPGSLCGRPSTYRYPEHVPYCSRSVGSDLKAEIIQEYDENFGYRIGQMDRGQFKIDHYIPLCMGGSNDKNNLWPQHASVYNITDRLEQVLCERMASGELRQREAVGLIRRAKNNLSEAPQILRAYDRRR